MSEALSLDSRLSPLEGCLLATLHLRAGRRALMDCRRLVLDEEMRRDLEALHQEKGDLQSLFRRRLGSIDSGSLAEAGAHQALLENSGLNRLQTIRERPPRLFRRGRQRRKRFLHLLQLEEQFQTLCQGLEELFADSGFVDEFRAARSLARSHLAQLKTWNESLQT